MTAAAPALAGVADPVFILAAPRSFSSVACAMLGQHPELYGLPETHLFGDETMDDWWERAFGESYRMAHGLVRAVAELRFGGQTERNVTLATAWLRRRRGETTGMVFEELAAAVFPRALVDKSPTLVSSVEAMRRALGFFPQARFVHLLRHPRGYCESVVKYMELLARPAYRPRDRASEPGVAPEWIRSLARMPMPSAGTVSDCAPVDPQGGWYLFNANVVEFLATIPTEQWVRVRGEDILARPDEEFSELASWLGLRTDSAAIEPMQHPELSPYARFGPRGARIGNDITFLERPTLRAGRGRPRRLEGSLGWRPERSGFDAEVVELARSFGYE
jgi:hypothetical protein